jgi:hypothetical protein
MAIPCGVCVCERERERERERVASAEANSKVVVTVVGTVVDVGGARSLIACLCPSFLRRNDGPTNTLNVWTK